MRSMTMILLAGAALAATATTADAGKKPAWKFRKTAALEQACAGKDALACTELGGRYESGAYEADKSKDRALEAYKQGCDAGDPRGCSLWGELAVYQHGDDQAAKDAIKKACADGAGRACLLLRQRDTWYPEVARDDWHAFSIELVKRAAKGYQAACDGGDLISCTELAQAMWSAESWQIQEWFPNNLGKAAKLVEKSCKAGDPEGCRLLGGMYEDGEGVPQSDAKAKSFYGKACKAGNPDACDNLEEMIADRRARGIRI